MRLESPFSCSWASICTSAGCFFFFLWASPAIFHELAPDALAYQPLINDPAGFESRGTWEAFFWVNDAEALHAEFNVKGAEIVYGPVIQEAYQMKEFAVRDCDGHVLGFGQAL